MESITTKEDEEKDRKRFTDSLESSVGDTLVIVHGHSYDMRNLSEQSPLDNKEYNSVSMQTVLTRYNDPNQFAAILIHGCNIKKNSVEADKVDVFFPPEGVGSIETPNTLFSPSGAYSPATQNIK